MKSLADIIAYNDAHADEALKFGQTQLTASQAIDLSDPATNAAYVANRDGGRAATRAAIDNALTTNNLDAIMTPSGTLTGTGARAGYPQIVVPAGYNAANRRPVGIAFNGTAYSEEKLLAFAYAYEQATKLRKPVSEINPAVWRCCAGNPRSCAPGKEVATGVTPGWPAVSTTRWPAPARCSPWPRCRSWWAWPARSTTTPSAFDDAYRAALLICAALLAAGGLLAFFTIRNPARRVVRQAPVPRPRRGLG